MHVLECVTLIIGYKFGYILGQPHKGDFLKISVFIINLCFTCFWDLMNRQLSYCDFFQKIETNGCLILKFVEIHKL